MEFGFKRLLVASVACGSIMVGGGAMAAGLSLPHIDTPTKLSVKTPGITTPSVSTPSKTTPRESAWAEVPGVALPVSGVGMNGEVHNWSLDQPNGTPPQHLHIGIPAVTVPSITVPKETVPSKTVAPTVPASAHVDPSSGTADTSATAAGKTVGADLH